MLNIYQWQPELHTNSHIFNISEIWLQARNSKSFNVEIFEPNDIVNKTLFNFHEYENNLIPTQSSTSILACNNDRNIITAEDGIILFADASAHKEKTTNIGTAVMDSYGNPPQAFDTPIQYAEKIITIEAITNYIALEYAKKKCWTKVQVLLYSKNVVHMIL
ncbi:hypothetical protein H5410_028417 [Solanum commersonii]|uniref:Uncharacterized protein n=1 Tax=Solanum commersonii TaxID=4109 RepID=A0A9J5Z3Z0_SOLCO|nr:hypothetical protein H5410_028417 [Solanum commersonii]